MALPILHRFIYRIKMLPLTEESTRLVFKCLSKYLKPIPFRQGSTLGQGRSPLCPVESLLGYLEIRGAADGPLFVRSNGAPLTRTVFTERLRRLLSQTGITGHFGSHSFRIGAATTALTAGLAGVPEHMIQTLGRWSSSVYLAYIRTPRHLLASVTRVLC
jgi:integrase